MIRQAVVTLFFAAGVVSSASAANIGFRGGGFLSNPTQACIDNGWGQVNYVSARYRPPNVGANGPQTFLAVHDQFSAQSYVLASGKLTSKFKNVQGGATFFGTALFINQAKVKVTFLQPETITASTQDVIIAGQIQGVSDLPGCKFDFRFSLTRQP